MERTSDLHPHPARPGFLAEVTLALLYIRDTRATGRISIRNAERFGLAHLYFNAARLIHIAGDKRSGEAILNDLLTWSRGSVRFDAALLVNYETVTWQQAPNIRALARVSGDGWRNARHTTRSTRRIRA